MSLNLIGECRHSGNEITVLRNEHGKFFVKLNGMTTQKNLNASEIVRLLLNAMHQEPVATKVFGNMSDADLDRNCKELRDTKGRIDAIKFARSYRDMGLKEAFDYVNGLK